MGLKKGQTNNPAGRKPGTINKISKDLRQSITDFLQENFEEVIKEWKKLPGKDKLKFYSDFVKFAVPTLQATELKTEFDKLTDQQLDYIIDELKKSANQDNE